MPRWARLLPTAALLLAGACSTVTSRRELPPPVPDLPPGTPAEPTAPPAVDAPPTGAAPTLVRVGLVVDTSVVAVGSTAGLTLESGGRAVGTVPAGESVAIFAGGRAERRDESGRRTGTLGALALPVTLRPQGSGQLTVRGKPYRGALVVQSSGDGVTAVNRVDMETYLLGVVPYEIGAVNASQVEAAKAQAVAARTYAVKYLGRRAQQGFDVYATVADQVYGGSTGENTLVSDAVRATAGEVMTYNGQPIEAYYHSTCAGQTAAIHEVWNQRPVPYLVSVRDVDPQTGQAWDRSSSRFRWTERWTHDQLVATLNRTLADSVGGRTIREIRDMRVLERTPSDRVRALRISTDAGDVVVGGDRVRWILVPTRGGLLNSSKFDVSLERAGGRVTAVVAEGGGWGHGIGMCQVGAKGRAAAGQDYRTILRTYYPGTQLTRLY